MLSQIVCEDSDSFFFYHSPRNTPPPISINAASDARIPRWHQPVLLLQQLLQLRHPIHLTMAMMPTDTIGSHLPGECYDLKQWYTTMNFLSIKLTPHLSQKRPHLLKVLKLQLLLYPYPPLLVHFLPLLLDIIKMLMLLQIHFGVQLLLETLVVASMMER